jgi:hypothetical protein
MPTTPDRWRSGDASPAAIGDLGDDVEGHENHYETPRGEVYWVVVVHYGHEVGPGFSEWWRDAGWELLVGKGRYSFAVTWGEPGRPDPTPTPGHPPLPRGPLTEGGDEAAVELLRHSPALTARYIRENRYEAWKERDEPTG